MVQLQKSFDELFLKGYKITSMTDFWFYVVIAIIILHFVVGFGYLIYKMSPKKEDASEENN